MRQLIRPLLVCGAAIWPLTTPAEWAGGIDSWGWRAQGEVSNQGDSLDLERDLRIQESASPQWWLGWSAAEPGWLPALSVRHAPLQAGGRNSLGQGSSFGPVQFSGSANVISSADLDAIDLLATWSFRGGSWLFRPGLRIQNLSGEFRVAEEGGDQDIQSFDQTYPLLHLDALYGLGELFGFDLGVEWISDGDNTAGQWHALLVMRLFEPMNLRVGWQARRYEIIDAAADYRLDARLGGLVAGISLSFP